MKPLLAALVIISALLPPYSFAAEVTYTANLKGIDCAACKKTISQALGKIKGVKTIRITKVSDELHRLAVVTNGSSEITKADATKALGKDSHYGIVSWTRTN